MGDNTVLTPLQVAEILKITKNTVYELIKRGELNGYRVGNKVRVDLADVEAYKDRSRTGVTARSAAAGNRQAELAGQSAARGLAQPSGGFVICGQDALLDILALRLGRVSEMSPVLRFNVGSYSGLYDLYMGRVQVASCHLWDGDSGRYNVPYVRRMLPGMPAVIIRLAARMQGFYVPAGNPKALSDWKDLLKPGVRLVNRELGSGTRVLLDEKLRLMGRSGAEIDGYDTVCMSHLAVAGAVAQGLADVGLGNEKAARQVAGITFLPIQQEQYDLVIRKDDWSKPSFQQLVEIIQSEDFRGELMGIGDYDLRETGRIIAQT